jgi:hypothetical protein
LLADKGLPTALEAQVRKSPIRVELNGDGVGRYPQDVEAAVYFCTLEALNNVAKYAEASSVTISLEHRDGHLTFSVSDDGRGFNPPPLDTGPACGMADRLDAIGGSIDVRSVAGSGTTVTGSIRWRRVVTEPTLRRLAWILTALGAVLLAFVFVITVLNGSFSEEAGFISIAIVMMIGYGAIGGYLAARLPRNPIGWLMLAVSGAFALAGLSDEWVTYTVIGAAGSRVVGSCRGSRTASSCYSSCDPLHPRAVPHWACALGTMAMVLLVYASAIGLGIVGTML